MSISSFAFGFQYSFYLPFFFAFNHVWGRSFVVRPMGLCFDIFCEEVDMENVVHFPFIWEREAVIDWGGLGFDNKWSESSGRKLS